MAEPKRRIKRCQWTMTLPPCRLPAAWLVLVDDRRPGEVIYKPRLVQLCEEHVDQAKKLDPKVYEYTLRRL